MNSISKLTFTRISCQIFGHSAQSYASVGLVASPFCLRECSSPSLPRIQSIYKVFSKSFNVLLICVKKTRDQLHETFFYWMLHWCAMTMKMRAHASELSKRSWGLSSTTSPYAMLANPIGKMSLSKADACVLLEMKKKMYSGIREGVKQSKQTRNNTRPDFYVAWR